MQHTSLTRGQRTALAGALQGALLAAASFPALAQETNADASLPAVVVTATGYEQSVADAPASVTVITRRELEKKPFRDLTDALREVQGVTVTGIANEQDIMIRGLPGTYTLILVDGKRQGTRDARPNGSGGFEQSFIPPLEAIERIEVVRGPMSSLYGSDAMGGVVNIITRKIPKTWGGSVGFDGTLQDHRSSGDAYQGQFYLGGPIKDDLLGLQVWGRQYQRGEDDIQDGFRRARDQDITARLAITPNRNHDILVEAGSTDVRRNASGGKSLADSASNTRQDHSREHYSLSHIGRYGRATSEVSLYREIGQRENYTRNAAGSYVRNARAPEIENTTLDAKLNMALGSHFVVAGGQWNKGVLTDQNPGRRTGVNEQFSITQQALFVEDEWRLSDKFSLTGGLRLDDHEVYGNQWSPRAYAVWHATDAMTFKGGVSRGFRAPDIRAIAPGYATTTGGSGCTYGPNGTCGVIVGDPNLKPETSTSYEISAHLDNKAGLAASATLFYTDFKDKVSNALIYAAPGRPARWEEDPNYRLWYNYNVDNATIRGVELTGTWQATKTVSLKSNYTYTDSRQKGGQFDGHALTRTPKHMANVRIDWSASPALTLWGAVNYHGKEINAAARAGSNGRVVTTNVMEYDDYAIADVGLSYALTRDTTLKAAVYNVGDRRLDTLTYNTVDDGRRYWFGVNTRF